MTKIINLSVKEKIYKSKKAQISILNGFRLEVAAGEKIAIVGESGAGKSSLLNIIGLLDRNYAGEYTLFGSPTDQLHTSQLAQWRNQRIGFVLQESALINSLTVEDNIKLPFLYASPDKKGVGEIENFDAVVSAIEIRHILKKKPLECSGGEKARAVFARGIIMKPQIILADEPTASLDVENRERIVTLLFNMNKEFNTTIITVTHDLEIANRHDRVIRTVDLSVLRNIYQFYSSLKDFQLETWVNNTGFGNYDSVAQQDLKKIDTMLRLNVEALTILSSLFVHDYKDVPGTQLINLSSCGGYTIVPTAVTYCATKFYVSTFTEGLAWELIETGAKMQAKVLAPAATQTEFGKKANNVEQYDYDKAFGTYHTSQQMAEFLLRLYDSDCTLGIVDRETFKFELRSPMFPYANGSAHNQAPTK